MPAIFFVLPGAVEQGSCDTTLRELPVLSDMLNVSVAKSFVNKSARWLINNVPRGGFEEGTFVELKAQMRTEEAWWDLCLYH